MRNNQKSGATLIHAYTQLFMSSKAQSISWDSTFKHEKYEEVPVAGKTAEEEIEKSGQDLSQGSRCVRHNHLRHGQYFNEQRAF